MVSVPALKLQFTFLKMTNCSSFDIRFRTAHFLKVLQSRKHSFVSNAPCKAIPFITVASISCNHLELVHSLAPATPLKNISSTNYDSTSIPFIRICLISSAYSECFGQFHYVPLTLLRLIF
jgi:hypothetical protein